MANCMVSSSQDVLYELFVSSVLESKNADDSKLNDTSTSYDHIGDTGESMKEMKRTDIQSLSNLITLNPSNSQSDNGTNLDIFSMLASTQCSLWLIDVIPLGELIGRFALQRFKVNKDSMDIFLEMVVAKQVDKLFMLAKADRNNTGECDMINYCGILERRKDGGCIVIEVNRLKMYFCNSRNYKFCDYLTIISVFSINTNISLSLALFLKLGKQLLALLAHDLSSENAKNILRKNAFALMRLRR